MAPSDLSVSEEAKSEIYDYIEVFYNRKHHHSYLNQMRPMGFEKLKIESYETSTKVGEV
jgi:hypothetical protein